jgi:hypothetical protein
MKPKRYEFVRAALLEDLGRAGDITTEAIVPDERQESGIEPGEDTRLPRCDHRLDTGVVA